MAEARAALGLPTDAGEADVLEHPRLWRQLGRRARALLDKELDTRYKPAGPRASSAWLTNTDIDATLWRYALLFPDFFPYPYTMSDFDTANAPLAAIPIRDCLDGNAPSVAQMMAAAAQVEPSAAAALSAPRRVKTVACVINTDVYSGRGKHWTCVFVDCRTDARTVEFFDSVGDPPMASVTDWMERTCADIGAQSVVVTDVRHQGGDTECGVYSLFYIRSRLENVPYERFTDAHMRVSDAVMRRFRRLLFR